MDFCTAIKCMDGRIQNPVRNYLKEKYNALYVDVITEPGPNKILAEQKDNHLINSIIKRVDISVNKHGSEKIAVVGHYDCAGNPTQKEQQNKQTLKSVKFLKTRYPKIEIIGLWVNENWEVTEI